MAVDRQSSEVGFGFSPQRGRQVRIDGPEKLGADRRRAPPTHVAESAVSTVACQLSGSGRRRNRNQRVAAVVRIAPGR
jgi:hypothetical protein